MLWCWYDSEWTELMLHIVIANIMRNIWVSSYSLGEPDETPTRHLLNCIYFKIDKIKNSKLTNYLTTDRKKNKHEGWELCVIICHITYCPQMHCSLIIVKQRTLFSLESTKTYIQCNIFGQTCNLAWVRCLVNTRCDGHRIFEKADKNWHI